jgi:hypothetical protein
MSIDKYKNLMISSATKDMTPKPKFLESLEDFLKEELKMLASKNEDQESARLQVIIFSFINNKIALLLIRYVLFFLNYMCVLNFFKRKAYREVFEYLIEEFKTYKPLLASIKNEYELMLELQQEKIRNLEPLKVK